MNAVFKSAFTFKNINLRSKIMSDKIYTYYDKLSVPRNATDIEIEEAFSKLSEKYKPENFADDDKKKQAERILKAITVAYENLIDPVLRTKHNQWIDSKDQALLSSISVSEIFNKNNLKNVENKVSQASSDVKEAFKNVSENVEEKVSKVGEDVKKAFKNTSEKIDFTHTSENVEDKIFKAGEDVKKAFKNASEKIDIDTINNELKNAKDIGIKNSSNILKKIFDNYVRYFIGALKKYAEFSGRATRKEYWFFSLYYAIQNIILQFIVDIFDAKIETVLLVMFIYGLVLFVPCVSLLVRRMHDIGKSGWVTLIPIYGFVCLFIQSQVGKNKYDLDYTAQSDTQSLFNDLQKLGELKEKGIITEEEFNLKKKNIMGDV